MSRRQRFNRNSHQKGSKHNSSSSSRRSNDNNNIENQNALQRPEIADDLRNVGASSDERHLQTSECHISAPPNDTTVRQGIDCITESDSSQLLKSKECTFINTSSSCGLSDQSNEGSTLLSLPDDVLYLLFTYLQPKELCLLSCVCRQLQYMTSKDTVWIHHAKVTAVVKPVSSSCRPCSAKELCRVAPNWRLGRFKEGFAMKHKQKLLPWVQKNDDGLWVSMGSDIHYFHPCSSNHLQEDKEKCLRGLGEDATRFMVKKDRIVSGYRDGSVSCWDVSGSHLFSYQQVHKSDTQCVDFSDSVIISGSRDTTCKVLSMHARSDNELVLQTFDAGERVWSLQISPYGSFFAAGLAGCLDDPPVIMWDIESGDCLGQLSMNHRRGAGVYDLRFESPHELLTCGYDTFIRLWDLRTQTCVRQWEEPHDSALYCIDSDGSNTIVVGTAHHGMVRLWDKRKEEPVQVYYSNKQNSPVYSVAMDYGHLYLALDVGLNVMDFTCRNTDALTAGCSTGLQDRTGRGNRRPRQSSRR